jgi:hypothetical protein
MPFTTRQVLHFASQIIFYGLVPCDILQGAYKLFWLLLNDFGTKALDASNLGISSTASHTFPIILYCFQDFIALVCHHLQKPVRNAPFLPGNLIESLEFY